MILALGVMFVTALLMVAAFEAANGDIHLSHEDATQKQAYYAALAGVQEYEYHLQANPDYWQTCSTPSNTVPQENTEHYEIKLLTASTAPEGTKECSKANPYGTMIQATGAAANTFRIESIGTSGKEGTAGYATRKIVATFRVVGFLDYAYFTQYEVEDPSLGGGPAWCGKNYRPAREKLEAETGEECVSIVFAKADSVGGPIHTDDGALICGEVAFGREGHNPVDTAEFNYGWADGGCGEAAKPKFNTATKNYTVGQELLPPEGDTSLGTYVKEEPGGLEFSGVTRIELNGTTNKLLVTNSAGKKEELNWPENGLVYVHGGNNACTYEYLPSKSSDNTYEEEHETECGNVYVSGTYSKSITIGAEEDVIIKGNVYPTSVAGKLGSEPTGTATLGLIAGGSVRVYHPLTAENSGSYRCAASNAKGSLEELWIYAAILSTNHSFVVDNYNCGAHLEDLHVYGAIAQRFRGIVGQVGGSGYTKDYKYDERLAVDEPPYFLNPINAGWEVARETAPEAG